MEEEYFKIMRRVTRERMYELWGRAKERDFKELDGEELRIAKAMVDHEDEFYNQMEFADLTYDHEYDPDTEYNPFTHIVIHSTIEAQLEQKEPLEAYQFYNTVRRKKYSHHDAIHFIGQILVCLIFDVMKYKRPFNSELYCKLLKKYKNRNPEKLMDQLENDPLLPK